MLGRASAVSVLARRFLLSKSSDRFLSFIAWVSVTGVGLGVLALVSVTSVINGFESELVRVITGMNGDVLLYSREPIRDADQIEQRIRRAVPQTQAVTQSFIAELMVSGPQGVAGVILEGMDPRTASDVTDVSKRLVKGKLPEGDAQVAVGSALAERIGVEVGQEIRLVIPFAGDEGRQQQPPTGSSEAEEGLVPKVLPVQVTGIVRMGMNDYDSKYLFATLPAVQKALNRPDEVTAFKIKLMPRANARAAAQVLSENFGAPFRAKDWSQFNRNLLYAIQLEKAVIAVILTAIVIVAAFNVVSTLMMMIHDKTKEIAILKAMGFSRAQCFRLFCLIGMGIGLIGTGIGVTAGLGVNWLLERLHWIDLPPDIYNIGRFPVIVRWAEVGGVALVAMLITFFATVYPAMKASNRPPLEGLRYD